MKAGLNQNADMRIRLEVVSIIQIKVSCSLNIYGPVNISAVIKVVDFPSDENGLFTLPGDINM